MRLRVQPEVPIYEFECESCGSVTPILWRSSTVADEIRCKQCNSAEIHKIISRVAVHRDLSSRLGSLDSKYDKMVDDAVSRSPGSDTSTHLGKLKPFK